jgi:uncharacterized protein (DUF433 family)
MGMKMKTAPARRKPVYYTLSPDFEKKMAATEAAFRRSRADLAREWAQERLDLINFPCLEFRSNGSGRFAVVRGTRLAVWQLASLARKVGWGEKLAQHLEILPEAVASAQGYYRSHRSEIDRLVEANDSVTFERLKQAFPKLRRLDEVPA